MDEVIKLLDRIAVDYERETSEMMGNAMNLLAGKIVRFKDDSPCHFQGRKAKVAGCAVYNGEMCILVNVYRIMDFEGKGEFIFTHSDCFRYHPIKYFDF